MKNYVTALGMALTIAQPYAAYAQTVTPPSVPANIQVPAGNHAFLIGHGVGTQNYVRPCQVSWPSRLDSVYAGSHVVQR